MITKEAIEKAIKESQGKPRSKHPEKHPEGCQCPKCCANPIEQMLDAD